MARYLEPARFKKLALGNWEMPCFSVVPHFFFVWRIVVTSLNLPFASWGLRMQQGWCLYLNWWKQAAKKSFGSVWLHSYDSFWLEFSWRILSDEKKRGPLCPRSACCIAAGVQYGHKSNQPGSQTFLPPLHSGIELVTWHPLSGLDLGTEVNSCHSTRWEASDSKSLYQYCCITVEHSGKWTVSID